MSADEPQTDREWLMRIDGKVDGLLKSQLALQTVVSGDDGQSGLCGRVSKLEGFYSYILGAAAIIAIVIPMIWDRIKILFGGS